MTASLRVNDLRVCVSLAVLTRAADSEYTKQILCEIPHHNHVQTQPEKHFLFLQNKQNLREVLHTD